MSYGSSSFRFRRRANRYGKCDKNCGIILGSILGGLVLAFVIWFIYDKIKNRKNNKLITSSTI